MAPSERQSTRSRLARVGFADLSGAAVAIDELVEMTGHDREAIITGSARSADPDSAVRAVVAVARRDPAPVRDVLADERAARRMWNVLGASAGFGEFFLRRPVLLRDLLVAPTALPTAEEMRTRLLAAVEASDGFASVGGDAGWNELRVAYRREMLRIAAFDLSAPDPVEAVRGVSSALSDAAAAALEASLAVARSAVSTGHGTGGQFPEEQVRATRLAIIGMGKAGASELNYVSDVDVIFVAGGAEGAELADPRMIDIASRLAVQTMRGISAFETEPPLWEVDANLRPEGAKGALVRTLDSHLAYYDRWAHSWEFQALLKARHLAGDETLGEAYVAATRPLVWASSERDGFVDSVQGMRERVSDNIARDEVDRQLKLGPGGLRDVEFTVQLLQLVHGRSDEDVRERGTLAAIEALVERGYIGRDDAAAFATDYRILRLLEHRLQLQQLRRTHLMPSDDESRRILARSTGLYDPSEQVAGGTAKDVTATWERVRADVRDIHVRLFYRPLLSAVAATEYDARALTGAEAHDRLAAIGFRDAKGALAHIAALTRGVSRKATVQRTLMPVMLRWFAEGVDPDYGLVAYRRISERLGNSPWFLRMLRDSAGAAESLTMLLSGSRYVGELMEWIPESVAWLDSAEQLRPRAFEVLDQEARAMHRRHDQLADAARAIRGARRRELLRTAIASMVGAITIKDVTTSLTTITDVTLQALLRAVRRDVVPPEHDDFEFVIVGMGRYGGAEIGFGSDADVLFVYRAGGVDPQLAERYARGIVTGLREASQDHRVPLELDAELRPEGRSGPIVRTLDAYRAYYARWSVSWEAQALLRARAVAGTAALRDDVMRMVDDIRYPERAELSDVREIKRIKARVESERMPKGVDPTRHLKLGPGGLSDVEWLVQLIQMKHAHRVTELRTPRTLHALQAAFDAGLLGEEEGRQLGAAWRLATRLRSANTLLTGTTSDVLPTEFRALDGIGRILEHPPGSAWEVEEEWLRTARRARRTYESVFYDL
ncbi:bifunctional [glutamine synthetase] adenylyltransferase/[glutamine synthetase]-adenylyl-L-tyrosine phosphorylase [Microbacterium karelineae]|uniref:bifunctional [glutamine synthetase] adenylyltransferase/[glutamine synthetase]-adenylyl-L-tyrosine phosphorylase n=1 Tax=Microbacterium karelineae TaxID=2654283 RepID=UPI0012E9CB12|nr:bifunctional [glutamine synthetase] adenylyltransferase/[glutamine synthetase]-adenylyl-L-tyrosine phosphorylase [Microbacterium karelineae]